MMAESGGPNLSEVYDDLWSTYQYMESTSDSCSDESYQQRAKSALKQAELGIVMVNELQLFSTNEDLEEVSSNEIRFMTLSALAGYFCYKIMDKDRVGNLEKSRSHFANFIKLCANYGLTSARVPSGEEGSGARPGSQEEIVEMAKNRQTKIERFKKQKETEKRLKDLYEKVKEDHVDEEVKRDYYTTLVEKFIASTLEEIDGIDRELSMLKRVVDLGGPEKLPESEARSSYRTPFILTKDDLQKRVFGMGYTNLPTYSIEEFYEREAAAGRLPKPEDIPGNPTPGEKAENEEREKIEKEKKEEEDDKESLEKQRAWDDWKDDHRRGWGNRQNMG